MQPPLVESTLEPKNPEIVDVYLHHVNGPSELGQVWLQAWPAICAVMELSSESEFCTEAMKLKWLNDARAGTLQIWNIWGKNTEGTAGVVGQITTRMIDEPLTGRRIMTVHTAYSPDGVLRFSMWKKIFDELSTFAKKEGCVAMHTLTSEENVKRLVLALGFKPKVTNYLRDIE